MITIYHNPRCRKSREGVAFLEASGKDFQIVEYLKDSFTESSLKDVVQKLNIAPIELVRKNEAIWKEQFKGTVLNDDELISAMVNNPKLIERPIVVHNSKAVIARPASVIETIL